MQILGLLLKCTTTMKLIVLQIIFFFFGYIDYSSCNASISSECELDEVNINIMLLMPQSSSHSNSDRSSYSISRTSDSSLLLTSNFFDLSSRHHKLLIKTNNNDNKNNRRKHCLKKNNEHTYTFAISKQTNNAILVCDRIYVDSNTAVSIKIDPDSSTNQCFQVHEISTPSHSVVFTDIKSYSIKSIKTSVNAHAHSYRYIYSKPIFNSYQSLLFSRSLQRPELDRDPGLGQDRSPGHTDVRVLYTPRNMFSSAFSLDLSLSLYNRVTTNHSHENTTHEPTFMPSFMPSFTPTLMPSFTPSNAPSFSPDTPALSCNISLALALTVRTNSTSTDPDPSVSITLDDTSQLALIQTLSHFTNLPGTFFSIPKNKIYYFQKIKSEKIFFSNFHAFFQALTQYSNVTVDTDIEIEIKILLRIYLSGNYSSWEASTVRNLLSPLSSAITSSTSAFTDTLRNISRTMSSDAMTLTSRARCMGMSYSSISIEGMIMNTLAPSSAPFMPSISPMSSSVSSSSSAVTYSVLAALLLLLLGLIGYIVYCCCCRRSGSKIHEFVAEDRYK